MVYSDVASGQLVSSADGNTGYVVSVRRSDAGAVGGGDRGSVERRRRISRAVSDPSTDKLHVVTRVSSRFVQTCVESTITNPGSENREATFLVQMPDSAFISNFTMVIDDDVYVGKVKEKAKAEEDYKEARRQNRTAGLVGAEPPQHADRHMQVFSVAINVRANSSAHIVLTYQQLLQRRLGLYELVTRVKPNQPVGDIAITIHLHDPQGIRRLYVIEPGQEATNSFNSVDTVIESSGHNDKTIKYNPSADTRRRLDALTGADGNFVVRYDVQHEHDAGLLQLDNGYFVHFFSPQGFDPLGKNIVFVIDISGSMSGSKMEQTRDAMVTILDQLRTSDRFLLLLFDHQFRYWPSNKILVQADKNAITSAKKFALDSLVATGATNINDALLSAVSLLKELEQGASSMILFLTDGYPSRGERNREKIVSNVETAAGSRVSIFSLGFGDSLDYVLLQSLAERTGGFARRIYEGIDADLQLRDLFLEIGTPLLYDVHLSYDDRVVDTNTLTRVAFPQYFNGSELAVAGKLLASQTQDWVATVTGMSSDLVTLTKQVVSSTAVSDNMKGLVEKLYIHMKIKDLLRQKLLTDDEAKRKQLDQYVIRIALEYNLVTPLTSMIIVEFNKNEVQRNMPKATSGDFASGLSNDGVYPGRSRLIIPAGFIAILVLSRHTFLS